jgi:hypothetical protein
VTRKPALWVALAIAALAAAAFSWRYFPEAFPLVSLDIRMDRQAALTAARQLAAERRIGPAGFREAASFSLDEEVQTFVELEGGGKPAFAALVADRFASPYHWQVRHFNERDANEVTLSFAPDGTPNGFVEHLAENAPGAALDSQAARQIAESTAGRDWAVDLSAFQPVEQSQDRKTGGRVDHTFVYERPDRQMGEGRYRLRLVTGGDRLTELEYFIRIPEAFSRRYEEMRSVNTAIGIAGSLAFLVLYGVGGMAIGLFLLGRQRWVIWKQPIFWGGLVAAAQTVATINEWPLAWMQYDTALSTQSFIAQRASAAVVEFMTNAALFSVSFMAAESLTRRAFPSHPQFWKIWRGSAPASPPITGRTAAGYMLVPLFIAYDVALYLYATKLLGWWTPSEALFNPDVLASYAPWYSAVAKSFQAGFWEESLFRAVPIAGAALIGDRLGNRRLWIIFAFAVQAAIFGAGHAPYPTQPAYARPVELVIPSIGFGLLYLEFGLLPGIILHFAFDAFWFAMPIFASSGAGSRIQQVMLVLVVLVPAWIVIARRLTTRANDVERNRVWEPPEAAPDERTVQPVQIAAGLRPDVARWMLMAGAVSAAIWIGVLVVRPLRHYPIQSSRHDAEQAARTALASAQLGPNWRFLPTVRDGGGGRHRFVLETGGPSVHDAFLGTYLELPGWLVSVRTFEGDVADRAESWDVYLDSAGRVERVAHALPESRPGASLDETAARQLAYQAFHDRYRLDAASLEVVSASPAKRPARTDWTITVKDTSQRLPAGEARLSAEIAGDEIADVRRFVFVPEEWERTERNRATRSNVIQGAGIVLPLLAMIGGVVGAMISWSRRQFAVRLFLAAGGLFLLAGLQRFINGFPSLMAALSTSQPLQLQLAILIATGIVGITIQSAAMGLVSGGVPVWSRNRFVDRHSALRLGIALGVAAAAARILSTLPAGDRAWPSYDGQATLIPFFAAAFDPIGVLLARIVFLTLVVAAANHLSGTWTKQRTGVGVLLVLIGGVLGNAASPRDFPAWIGLTLVIGAIFLAVYVLVLRHDLSIVPIAAAVMTSLGALREGLAGAYPASLGGTFLSVVLMSLIGWTWFRALEVLAPAPVTAPVASLQ